MSRHRSFTSSLNQFSRSVNRMAKAAERAQRQRIREMERQLKIQAKENELQAHRELYQAMVEFERSVVQIHHSVAPTYDWERELTMRVSNPEPLPDTNTIMQKAKRRANSVRKSPLGWFSGKTREKLAQEAAEIEKVAAREAEQIIADYHRRQGELHNIHNNAETERIGRVRALMDGKPESMVSVLHERLERIEDFPTSFSSKISAHSPNKISLQVELPDATVIPENVAQLLKSGKLANKKKSETARNTLYVNMICSLALRLMGECFALLPSVKSVQIDGFVPFVDPRDGSNRDLPIISTICSRAQFERLVLKHVVPLEAVRSFTTRLNLDRQFTPSEVIVFPETNEAHDESTVDLEGISPEGFEHLIRELCQRMGMESIVTKSSHDGGIDVVAVDPTPLRGGRYVIQCKRYKNVVPVDAYSGISWTGIPLSLGR